MFRRRIVIPRALRPEVLQSLHSAHQGVTGMNERVKTEVYWPGITRDIQKTRDNCMDCNRTAPSHAPLPPIEPNMPTTPFEALACDYFMFRGWNYLVAADRLSGWTEIFRIRHNTPSSGSSGLCTVLRKLFATFGVPVEISSDGGTEFTAQPTQSFFKRWGVRHRQSSSYLPSSNGRAELAVKSAKRLLMDNISTSGTLDTDKMVRALLMLRNTPDPDCKLSPAEVLFGRRLRDSLPCISKDITAFENPHIAERWKNAWSLKERALKQRYVRTLETLNTHTRSLNPLQVGDRVLIQNQAGNNPKRWDRSGVVMEKKEFDQYLVKIEGSGRLSLRNRRFLRQIKLHDIYASGTSPNSGHYSIPLVSTPSTLSTPALVENDNAIPPSVTVPENVDTTKATSIEKDKSSAPSPVPHHVQPDVSGETYESSSTPPNEQTLSLETHNPVIRRSSRDRVARKFYEPETGKYVTQR